MTPFPSTLALCNLKVSLALYSPKALIFVFVIEGSLVAFGVWVLWQCLCTTIVISQISNWNFLHAAACEHKPKAEHINPILHKISITIHSNFPIPNPSWFTVNPKSFPSSKKKKSQTHYTLAAPNPYPTIPCFKSLM